MNRLRRCVACEAPLLWEYVYAVPVRLRLRNRREPAGPDGLKFAIAEHGAPALCGRCVAARNRQQQHRETRERTAAESAANAAIQPGGSHR